MSDRLRRLCHKVEQRLVLRRRSLRCSHCRQWFDAFPALGQKQPHTVVLERSDPVGMAQDRCQISRIRSKAFLRGAPIVKIHTPSPPRLESPLLPNSNRVPARGNFHTA
jgi:hypothetical protein